MSEDKEYQVGVDVGKGKDRAEVTVVSVERGFVCDECHDPLIHQRTVPTVYWAICNECGKYQMTREFMRSEVVVVSSMFRTDDAKDNPYLPCTSIGTFSDGTKA